MWRRRVEQGIQTSEPNRPGQSVGAQPNLPSLFSVAVTNSLLGEEGFVWLYFCVTVHG